MEAVKLEIGDQIPSRLDLAYFNYTNWCSRLGYPAAAIDTWLRAERSWFGIGGSVYSVIKGAPTREQTHRATLATRRTNRAKKFAREAASTPPTAG